MPCKINIENVKLKNPFLKKLKYRPKEITSEDIKNYRGNITEICSDVFILPEYLLLEGHRFGYESDSDPVNYDPDNILNVLIDKFKNANEEDQEEFAFSIVDIFDSAKNPWQVIVRLIEAYRNGDFPNINDVYFDNKSMIGFADGAIYSGDKENMYFLRALFNLGGIEINESVFDETEDSPKDKLIHSAVRYKRYDAAKFLMEHGADPILKGDNGKDACYMARKDPKMAKILNCPPILSNNAKEMRKQIVQRKLNVLKSAVPNVLESFAAERRSERSHILAIAPAVLAQPRAGAGGPQNSKGGTRRLKRRGRRTIRR